MSDSPIDALPRAMPNVVLQPSGWPRPKGYANGIKARGDLLFLGGMVGADERGRFAPDFLGQTRQLLANILTVLAEGGASARHIVLKFELRVIFNGIIRRRRRLSCINLLLKYPIRSFFI